MIISTLCLLISLMEGIPPTLFLVDGSTRSLERGFAWTRQGITCWNSHDEMLLIPYRFVNFSRTYWVPPKPPPPKPPPKVQREVPWHLPQYREKQIGFTVIEVTNESIQKNKK